MKCKYFTNMIRVTHILLCRINEIASTAMAARNPTNAVILTITSIAIDKVSSYAVQVKQLGTQMDDPFSL